MDQEKDEEEEEEEEGNYEERESRSPGTGHRTEPEVWNRRSVPPDLVASAEGLRVVRVEPRTPVGNHMAQVQHLHACTHTISG